MTWNAQSGAAAHTTQAVAIITPGTLITGIWTASAMPVKAHAIAIAATSIAADFTVRIVTTTTAYSVSNRPFRA
jgi:hypothetical protein